MKTAAVDSAHLNVLPLRYPLVRWLPRNRLSPTIAIFTSTMHSTAFQTASQIGLPTGMSSFIWLVSGGKVAE